MHDPERRGHLRYRDPNAKLVRLLIGDEPPTPVTALPLNESHTGLACVYVGPPLEVDGEVLWEETEGVRTTCRITRCKALYKDVHLLALQIVT